MTQTIEHFVLIKVKEDSSPSKINSMVDGLNSLISIDNVLHLSSGPTYKTKSTSSSFNFTHMVHGRFKSKQDLENYLGHSEHTRVVNETMELYDDVMLVDWVADVDEPLVVPSGAVIRLSLLKLKEGLGESEKTEVLKVIGGIKAHFGSIIKQFNFGENFAPAKTNGFSIGSLAIVPGLSELETLDLNEEVVKEQKEKLKDFLEDVIIVDYVVPPAEKTA
ncbi:Stress-response A/B barrel domain-containing protein UP3 [Thalictrum thalictroides]|uniref:Stress-response A/B barrel domain-containing protein UP3 n=1 Tax=Thalictrum thalictroides TaxID=46969 RepID=A0A7J6X1R2_THATH|nr:Stress-response A/B barrel domain-containing protein UP3 [Thalictrum thalictroides]